MNNVTISVLVCALLGVCPGMYAMNVQRERPEVIAAARTKNLIELGKIASNSKDYEKAHEYFVEAGAQEEDKESAAWGCLHCAKLYFFGWGVASDRNKVAQLVDQGILLGEHSPSSMAIKEFGRILKYDVDPNAGDSLGTPLRSAILCDLVEVVELLIAKGADIENIDRFGSSALECALVTCVTTKNFGSYEGSETSVLEILLEHGAALHSEKRGWNALFSAACYGKAKLVELLLERGADLHSADKRGKTALHGAAERGHTALVSLLVQKGANIEAVSRKGRTSLHLAAYRNHLDVVRLLVAQGANRNARDCEGKRPYDLIDTEMQHLLASEL